MGQKSAIQWTDATWNIARGCTKVDEDCKYCYMYRDSFDGHRYNPRQVERTKTVFKLPLKLKEPSKIFTSSLTDFFHEDIDPYRHESWDIIRDCPQHTFQILTKRPERIMAHLPGDWGDGWPNVWLGTSVGGNQAAHTRIMPLVRVPAHIHFISFEPLWEEIDLNIDIIDLLKIDWAIIGGESGNDNGKYKYRPCKLEWIEYLIKQMNFYGAAVFVKQLGTYLAKEMKLHDRHGGDIEEWPEHLKIRQFPINKTQKQLTQ